MSEIRLKTRDQIHMVIVGEPGYPPRALRNPVDTRRLADACQIEGCTVAATQAHGPPETLILTCDSHAEAVILALLGTLVDGGPQTHTGQP